MRPVLRTAAYAVSLILALACFTGCMRLDDGTDDQKKPGGVPYATTEPMPTSASYKFALVVVSKSMELNGCSVTYPFVCDQNSEMLNVAIHAGDPGGGASSLTFFATTPHLLHHLILTSLYP